MNDQIYLLRLNIEQAARLLSRAIRHDVLTVDETASDKWLSAVVGRVCDCWTVAKCASSLEDYMTYSGAYERIMDAFDETDTMELQRFVENPALVKEAHRYLLTVLQRLNPEGWNDTVC